MKRIYSQPTCIVVELGNRDALLQSVSGGVSLEGTSFGGTTFESEVPDADVKGFGNRSIWDNEW